MSFCLLAIVLSVLLGFTASDYSLKSSDISYASKLNTGTCLNQHIFTVHTLYISVDSKDTLIETTVLPSTHVTPGLTLILYGSWGCPTFVISYIFFNYSFFCVFILD